MSIKNTTEKEIKSILAAQREFFASNATLDRKFRKEQLRKLLHALNEWEKPLCEALWQDLHKSAEEAILTELKTKYPTCRWQDASFKEYGYGATMVTV